MGGALDLVELAQARVLVETAQLLGRVVDVELKKVGQQIPVSGHAFQSLFNGKQRYVWQVSLPWVQSVTIRLSYLVFSGLKSP